MSDTVKVSVAEDGKSATFTVDLTGRETETSTGKAYMLASSHGWQDVGASGARYSLNVTLGKSVAAALDKAAAEAKPTRSRQG